MSYEFVAAKGKKIAESRTGPHPVFYPVTGFLKQFCQFEIVLNSNVLVALNLFVFHFFLVLVSFWFIAVD